VYVTLSFRYLNKYKQTNKDTPGLKWLQQLIGAFAIFAAVWVIYLVPYVIPRYTNWMLSKLDWYPVYIPVTVLIYWLGIRGYLITWQLQTAEKKAELQLPEATVDTALESLKRSMEQDRLYLNTTLTLTMLAAHTGLPAKTISAVLNQHLHKNFNEFVNSYRVELFKERLAKDDAGQLTFAGLANDCGFSSPATFQRVFKQLTGMSPSEFRKTLPEARS
jgi:AraC-like DNA-binding protein